MTRSEERRHGKLKLYRRHLPSCPHKSKGRAFDSCKCPIWIQGTWGEKKIRHALKVDTWEAAEVKKRNIQDGVEPKTEPSKSIKDALDAYLKDASNRNLSAGTLKKYRRVSARLTVFAEARGFTRLADFTADTLRDFRGSWNLAPLTASKEIGFLRAFFTFCISNDWIAKNPAKAVKAGKVKDNPRLPFHEKEVQAIIANAQDDRELAFLLVLRHTGLRIGDASLLRVTQLNENRVHLYTSKAGTPVSILIPETLATLLKKLPAPGGYFFLRGESVHPHTASDLWRKRIKAICKTLAIKPDHPHRFRHSLAKDLLSKNVSVENVAAILGNSPAIVAKHYSQWIAQRQDALDAAVSATWKPALARVK